MSRQTLLLSAFLPLDLRRALARGEALPELQEGTALFADVSGFTPLMEHLVQTLGPRQGAEELTLLLNELFTHLVDQVHRHGGSVIAFGGDALTCWFWGDVAATAPRAAACACQLLRLVEEVGAERAAHIPAALSMHVGLASGRVRRLRAGGPPHGFLDVLAGAVLERMGQAERRAGAGQAVADHVTAQHLPAEALQPLESDFVLLGQPAALPSLPPVQVSFPLLPDARVRPWLAGPLYRRLQAGEFTAELRRVSSIFVQFSGLDYEQDPQVGQKLQEYIRLVQETASRFEGYLAMASCGDKGSLLHILFGAPLAHEDDARRAVDFALTLQEAAKALAFIRQQRMGVSMGQVYAGVLGSPRRCTYTVLGDEVNVSARLMETAAAGQILVSKRVQEATAAQFSYRPLGQATLKGKEQPIPIFEPAWAKKQPAPPPPTERLIGREGERRVIASLLDILASGRGHLLQITGEAGVGKSALLRELLRQAQERGWPTLVGACLSYGRQTPYLPWRTVIGQLCELAPEMSSEQQIARLEEATRRLPDPPGQQGYWQARFPLLAEAMGLAAPDTPLTRTLEGELRRDNTFQVMEALVRQATAAAPTVVALEDAYWADELSLTLAARIGQGLADVPLLLVLVQRPFAEPATEALLALREIPHQTTLALGVLGQEMALELARERLDATALPPALETLLHERARGNPFFIEEMVRAIEEGGYLRRRGSQVELTDDWKSFELPDTIEGVVQARLDRLREEERLTLKVASVIGRTFQQRLLADVHPSRPGEGILTAQLAALNRANFTQVEEGPPAWLYAFRHPILHEVTYGTLLFAQRRRLHGAIGAALERWHADDITRGLDLLAYHYSRSEEREKALHYLQLAGDKARREYAPQSALDYYNQALERVEPQEQERRYDLLAGRERIYDLRGERSAQERDLEEMSRLAEMLGDRRRQVEVLNRRARLAVDTGAFEAAREAAGKAASMAKAAGFGEGAADAEKTRGIIHGILGEYEEALAAFTRAQETYRAAQNQQGEASCLINLGLVHLYQGRAEQARDDHSQALALARALGNRLQETQALINLGMAELYLGVYEEALHCYQQALSLAREIGSTTEEELALNNLGFLSIMLGDQQAAAACHRQALHLARKSGDREGEAINLGNLGLLAACRGEWEEGDALIEQALELYRSIGHRHGEASVLHDRGVTSFWAQMWQRARASLTQALELRQEIEETDNALVTRAWLALVCAVQGDQEAACAHLAETLAQLESGSYRGDSPEQEIWWAIYRAQTICGEESRAHQALARAYRLVQEQAGRIQDPSLKRSFLERVLVNREIVQAWEKR